MKSDLEPSQGEVFIRSLLAPLLERMYYKPFVTKMGLKGNEKVIDFGSGPGICAKCIANVLHHGGQLSCVDISSRWLEAARRRLSGYRNATFYQGKIGDLNLKPSGYDLIVIHFVIHDIPKPERKEILDHLKQALRSGGRIIIREPLDEKHGIQTEELHALFTGCDLRKISLTTEKLRFAGHIAEGIFQKP
ncbi:MAG: class I SAM-dependent methyltransferase [Peptococcaceae bacterium]|nr:class I SAM-dependent methyltransferase [Peptococcaceae bacterium]